MKTLTRSVEQRIVWLAVLFLILATCLGTKTGARAEAIHIDPLLQTQLATLAPADQLLAVVNFDPTVTSGTQLASAIQHLGAGTITFNNLDSVGVLGTATQINALPGLPGVTGIYANRQLTFFMPEANSYIGADTVWNTLGITGQGVGIAILDSGIDGTHPDLAFGSKTVQNVKILLADAFSTGGNSASPSLILAEAFSTGGNPVGALTNIGLGPPAFLAEAFSTGGNPRTPGLAPPFFEGTPVTNSLYVEGLANTDTSTGHGTHVAGIAAGAGVVSRGDYQGVAKDATLIGIGVGDALFALWVLSGFDYLLDHAEQFNIKVVNNSWGAEGGSQAWDPNDPVNRATKKVHDRGITVVFAAGNSGPAPDTMNPYAAAPWVIGVAAGCYPQNAADCPDGLLAGFSARGMSGSAQFHPTLTAPGGHIVSTRATTGATLDILDAQRDLSECGIARRGLVNVLYYTCSSGTSMAAAHVTGTVALMQQAASGRLTPDEVKELLVQTARPMAKNNGTRYELWEVGAGYLDAYAAVLGALR